MGLALPAGHVSVSIPVAAIREVAEASASATALAAGLQFGEPDLGRVARVVTEAATNILQHAEHGEILLRSFALGAGTVLEVLALDQGPGIANVAQAARDGFSTRGGRGLGLGAIARHSTFFDVSSAPGKGTALLARIGPLQSSPPQETDRPAALERGVVCTPKRGEQVCGDAWAVAEADGRSTILIVDGLGHGDSAFVAAQRALLAFGEHGGERPLAKLRSLHAALRETRGAVAALAEIDWTLREVRYAGVGNIAGSLLPVEGKSAHLVSHNGTLGETVTRLQEFTYAWPSRGLLVLHSDGLANDWELESYPGLTRKDPSLIAGVLYRDFARQRDDVVVFVGRERELGTARLDGGPR